jgi:excisionase family DNA binding protein
MSPGHCGARPETGYIDQGAASIVADEEIHAMAVDADRRMLTIDDVSSQLNVSISTVRRLVRDQQLPAYRVGGRLRFKPEEVAAYIDAQRIGRSEPKVLG